MLSHIEDFARCLPLVTHFKGYDGMVGFMRIDNYSDALVGSECEIFKKKRGNAAKAFVSGRQCVRVLQKQLGLPEFDLAQGEFGPIWPSGLVGSISHSKELAAATILRDFVSVGVDIEKRGRLKLAAAKRVATKEEYERYSSFPDFDWTLLFSAKESVFKAISPLARSYIGFREVEVVLDPVRKSFSASYLGNQIDKVLFKRSKGHWIKFAGHLITLVTVD